MWHNLHSEYIGLFQISYGPFCQFLEFCRHLFCFLNFKTQQKFYKQNEHKMFSYVLGWQQHQKWFKKRKFFMLHQFAGNKQFKKREFLCQFVGENDSKSMSFSSWTNLQQNKNGSKKQNKPKLCPFLCLHTITKWKEWIVKHVLIQHSNQQTWAEHWVQIETASTYHWRHT